MPDNRFLIANTQFNFSFANYNQRVGFNGIVLRVILHAPLLFHHFFCINNLGLRPKNFMTKLSEFKDSPLYESKLKYVSEVWSSWRGAREQTLNRITNYLFVLNSGALLATLTYVATKSANNQIQTSIWLFAAGIFCSAAHAALDYYMSELSFKAYRKDVDDLYGSKLEWEDFVKRNENRPPCDWLLHTLGWLGGAAFFGGLVVGLCQIRSA